MIPKILVWKGVDTEELLKSHEIFVDKKVVSLDALDTGVDDFRLWMNSTTKLISTSDNYVGVIWNSHKLSWECQAVLLKPLEEMSDGGLIVLVSDVETGLVETISSRCELIYAKDSNGQAERFWPEVINCWKAGPSACLDLSEKLDDSEAEKLAMEVITRVRKSLSSGVSDKRIRVLALANDLLQEMRAKKLEC